MDIHFSDKKHHRVWLNQHFFPQIQQGDDVINYMNGKYNDNYEIVEYIQDFGYKLDVVQGFDGCDGFYDGIIGQILDHKFLAYFQLIKNRLKSQFNYKEYVNLYCYCYDWRQSLFDKKILSQLENYIKLIYKGQKIIIITHSAGGLLIQNLILTNPNVQQYIDSIITINCPYDGAGGNASTSILFGYNLLMGFPSQSTRFLTSKIMTWKGLITQNWNLSKNYSVNKYQIPSGIILQLNQSQKINDASFGYEFQNQYNHLQQKYLHYMPHINRISCPYGGELLLYIVCKENIKKQENGNNCIKNFCGILKKLSYYCRKQFLGCQFCIDFHVFCYCQKSCQHLFDFQNQQQKMENCQYKLFTPYNIQINFNQNIIIDSKHMQFVHNGFNNIFTTNDNEELIKIAYLRNIQQLKQQNVQKYSQKQQDLEQFVQNQIQPNTFEEIFYGINNTASKIYDNNRIKLLQQLQVQNEQQFKCFNILSCGKRTPQFSIIQGQQCKDKIQVHNNQPKFIYVDGDGLVPLLSSVSCPFKNQTYIIPNVSHFMIMQDKRMIDILCNIVSQQNHTQ